MGRKDANEIIKEAREEKGITQEELAKMIRISRNKMEKIEAGNYNIKPRFLKRMSKYIDINYDYYRWKNKQNPIYICVIKF